MSESITKNRIKLVSLICSLLVVTLFIPYVIWNAINFLFTFLICSIPFTQKYVAIRKIPKFDIIGVLLLRIGYVPNWFLQYLIIFSIVLPAFYRLYYVKLVHLITIIVLILIYVFVQNNEVYYLLIFYMIGIFFSINYKNLKFNFNISSLIIFVVTSLLILLIGHEHRIICVFEIILLLSFWFSIPLFPNKYPLKSDISFLIYESHEIIFMSIFKLLYIFLPKTNLFCLLNYVFTLIFGFGLTYIVFSLVKKISCGLYTIIGGR